MSEPSGTKPKRGSKPSQSEAAADDAKATKHKKWVKKVEASQLARLLRRDEADVAKALKKTGVTYTVEALRLTAPSPANQELVLYMREGKLAGYAVGATPRARKPAARKPATPKPAAKKTP